MDAGNQGFLLVATTMVLLLAFAAAILAVMLIYRRRKLQHHQEIREMNERFEKELLRSQLEVQGQTMVHIGREIHDNVGSQLTLAFLNVLQLETTSAEQDQQIEEIGGIINQALSDLRGLSANLKEGSVTMSTPLQELLRQECAKLNSVNFCEVQFQNHLTEDFGTLELNSFLLRIVQEFAQNSLKHAQCSQITISLEQVEDKVLLKAEDNGKGFDPQSLPPQAGIGLSNMQQRAEIIGAEYYLDSLPGKGTRLTLILSAAPN